MHQSELDGLDMGHLRWEASLDRERGKMIDQLAKMEMPDWLTSILKDQENVPLNIENILKDSLYYPACGVNGTPVKHLVGNIFSFVYADYGIRRDVFLNNLHGSGEDDGFKNYHLIFEKM